MEFHGLEKEHQLMASGRRGISLSQYWAFTGCHKQNGQKKKPHITTMKTQQTIFSHILYLCMYIHKHTLYNNKVKGLSTWKVGVWEEYEGEYLRVGKWNYYISIKNVFKSKLIPILFESVFSIGWRDMMTTAALFCPSIFIFTGEWYLE